VSGAALGVYDRLFDLAAGGMGTVEIARHRAARGVERLVVVKRIHAHLAAHREFSDMFVDEARLASQIRDPHVVPVDDVVDHEGELFLVQPYVESIPLSALLAAARDAGERLAPAIVSRIVGDALSGLDGAHHAVDLHGEPLSIVHRDVSPQNILVGTDGRSRVIDFGIAKAARRITTTASGTLKGKIAYMSPEALRRTPIDARADVFAAGVVLYEALTGARPFQGEDEGDTLLSILMGDPEPPSSLVPSLPPLVDEVTRRALAADRDERCASAAELSDALHRAIAPAPPREVGRVVERLAGAELAERRARIRDALTQAGVPRARPSRLRLGLAFVLALLALASVGLALASRRSDAPVAAPGSAPPPATAPLPVATSEPAATASGAARDAPSAIASVPTAAPTSRSPAARRPPPRASAPRPPKELHPNPYGGPR
jgi:eukaryotic-like serine/threonine-protein kinase